MGMLLGNRPSLAGAAAAGGDLDGGAGLGAAGRVGEAFVVGGVDQELAIGAPLGGGAAVAGDDVHRVVADDHGAHALDAQRAVGVEGPALGGGAVAGRDLD